MEPETITIVTIFQSAVPWFSLYLGVLLLNYKMIAIKRAFILTTSP